MAVITVSVLPDREHQHVGRAQHNARHLPILYDCPAITTAKPLWYPPQNIQNSEIVIGAVAVAAVVDRHHYRT
jgi:hypothetical protein